MTTQHDTSAPNRIQHQMVFWDQYRQAQPLNAEGDADVFALSGTGTVTSFTTVATAAEEFAPFAPYVLAHVQLDEGPVITAQLTDLDDAPAIGMRVEMVVRKLRTDGARGIIVYGPKFRPLLRPETT